MTAGMRGFFSSWVVELEVGDTVESFLLRNVFRLVEAFTGKCSQTAVP